MATKTSAGFEARSIDRLMRSRHAELVGSVIGACSSLATLLTYSAAGSTLSQFLHVLRTRIFFLTLFSVLFAIGGWWTVRTWRRLWRRGRSPWERVVYDYGVRMFGFFMAISLFLIITWLGWDADSGVLFGPLMTGGAVAALFFGTPVALHLGYFWGRGFAALVGVEKNARVELGDPPRMT